MTHFSVMLEESINALDIKPEGNYIDATFGRGGHSKIILSKLNKNGKLIVIDKDLEAIEVAKKISANDERLIVKHGSFAKVKDFCEEENLTGKIDGVLLDLGVSSPQLDESKRGFSFMNDGPLDMRMDQTKGITASAWLETASELDIKKVLKIYGEEKFAARIAKEIVKERKINSIVSTRQLVEIIKKAMPFIDKNKHPATRTFQAIRIVVNNELGDLESFLKDSFDILDSNGRLVVITFHSLEDRIVKKFIEKNSKDNSYPVNFPVRHEQLKPKLLKLKKKFPSENEININRRSRSAILRVAVKSGAGDTKECN